MNLHGDILVTGANSGLGKHCCEIFDGVAFTRKTNFTDIMRRAEQKPFRAIIHSAFNAKNDINSAQLYSYLHDTTFLTKKLLSIPHEKFIFISSTDVYPKDNHAHREEDAIQIKDITNIYGISKLVCESIVQNELTNYLILRPTALLGCYARPNSLIKILTHQNPTLTLGENSTFNYIRHKDVSEFIEIALADNLQGIYNLAASANIKLGEVKTHFKKNVTFGDYIYDVGTINNQKAKSIFLNLQHSSMENILLFLSDCHPRAGGDPEG